jgi:hypothetical protein
VELENTEGFHNCSILSGGQLKNSFMKKCNISLEDFSFIVG